jgi:hypothetical protein
VPDRYWAAALSVALLLTGCSGAGVASSGSAVASSDSATLSWSAPTTNTDGSRLKDLAGYRVYGGTNPDNLAQIADIKGGLITWYVIAGLTPGTHFFVVRAYSATGQLSAASNIVSKSL